jgi:UDP-N-acetylmuramoylalanine--D-glutamate ligase
MIALSPEILRSHAPIAILGAGVSGRAVSAWMDRHEITWELFDEKAPEGVSGFHPTEGQIVVFSPGFPTEHPWILGARKAGATCLSELEFGLRLFPGKLWGVTGTVGKTSLTRILAAALNSAGVPAIACGNIGLPVTQCLLSDPLPEVLVVEISSFQSETLPAINFEALAWTNFSENHLDRHSTLEGYFKAKLHLFQCPAKVRIAGNSVLASAQDMGISLPENTLFCADSLEKSPVETNFLVARSLWKALGLPLVALEKVLSSFQPDPYRFQLSRRHQGWTFWNDSKSTTRASVLAALQAVQRPRYWLGGGSPKGEDLVAYASAVAPHFDQAFLFGTTGQSLARELASLKSSAHSFKTMEESLSALLRSGLSAGSVVFSPGFASFDQFQNYYHRGQCFEETLDRILSDPIPA